MNEERLLKFGFNDNEATVFASLVNKGEAPASELIDTTGLHRNIVYNQLNRLSRRGLVTFHNRDGRRIYQVADPNQLVRSIEERREELAEKKEAAKELAEDIRSTDADKTPQRTAEIYKGKQALRTYFEESLEADTIHVLGVPSVSFDIMSNTFWENYTAKLDAHNVHVNLLINAGQSHQRRRMKDHDHLEVREFDDHIQPLTEARIHDESVAMIVWSEDPTLFRIDNEDVAASYKQYFDELWSTSG